MIGDFTSLTKVLKSNIGDLKKEVGLLKRAMGNILHLGNRHAKVKVLEPKAYNGTQNIKDLENFLWDMEQYIQDT